MWIWLISFFSVINITEKMALCGIFLSAQCYKHSFRHFLWVCQVVFTVFVLMPPEQIESLVVLFNSFCVHMSNNLDMFWVWLCFCTERGHSDLTGGPVFFSFFFFWSHGFCLFLPRVLWNKVEVTSSKEDAWDEALCAAPGEKNIRKYKLNISVTCYLCDSVGYSPFWMTGWHWVIMAPNR